ncbi:hypothetical protein [Microbacterium gilvum]|uniref:Uncharacterized protein n=1 Tax=Microbacterium gilvum TaxID=1336204 RepID=A0ABP9A6E3_9MICO
MGDVPTRRTRTIHEWVIETPCDAKQFALSLHLIQQELDSEFPDKAGYDDAYEVIARDNEIVIQVIER